MSQQAFQKQIQETFNLDDLRALCLDLGFNYDELPGDRLSRKIEGLLVAVYKAKQFKKLVNYFGEQRPNRVWPTLAEVESYPWADLAKTVDLPPAINQWIATIGNVGAGAVIAQGDGATAIGTQNIYLTNEQLTAEQRAEIWASYKRLPLDTVPEPDPSQLPPGSYFNMQVNLDFVGRQTELKQLAQLIASDETAATVAIAATGLGGIGKTQLAAEFCHRYGRYFGGGVFWLNFESAETARTDLAQIAPLLDPRWQQLDANSQINLILNDKNGWTADLPRLLVFDNLEEPELLRKYRPTGGGCKVLLTSRRGNWEQSGVGAIESLRLDTLEREESIALLQQLAERLKPKEADAIAEKLGDLPLALHLAGSFLGRYQSKAVEKYLEELTEISITSELAKQAARIEKKVSVTPTDHIWYVGRTFKLSYDQLWADAEEAWAARRILARLAVFALGVPVPNDLLFATFGPDARAEENEPQPEPLDELIFEDGVDLLLGLGLVEKETFREKPALMLHRLTADFVQAAGDNTEEDLTTAERELCYACNRLNNAGYPREMLPYHPHLNHVLEQVGERQDMQTADLMNAFAVSLDDLADHARAKPYYEEALEIKREVLGDRHPGTALSLNNLGFLLHAMGELAAAKPYHEEALDIRKAVLGDRHPDTAQSLNNLGFLLRAMGELPAAKPYYEEALDIRKAVLGDRHPDTAISLNNLGFLLRAMGDFTSAKPYYEEALEINRAVLGDRHPDTALSLNNLGALLDSMGDFTSAKPYHEEALDIRKAVLGDRHPDTAQSLNNLGGLLNSMGDFTSAKPYYEEALDIRKAVLGDRHPDTATSLNNLGFLYNAMGDIEQATAYFVQALSVFEEKLGANHPNTKVVRGNLESLL